MAIEDSFRKIVVVKDVMKPYMDGDGILTCNDLRFLKHKLDYRVDGGMDALSTETFAHFYETTTANPEALETLKNIFT